MLVLGIEIGIYWEMAFHDGEQRARAARLSWCPSCGEARQDNYCVNCAELDGAARLLRDAGLLPAFREHLRRMDEAVAASRRRVRGEDAGVLYHAEADTLLRSAGIGPDDRRLW